MLLLSEALEQIKKSDKLFYVYVLHKPSGVPFYVGKGKKQTHDQRIAYHEQEARANGSWVRKRHFNRLKLNTIRQIWKQGKEVHYSIDSWHDTEMDVYDRENYLILSMGRRADGTGPLTNLTEGQEKEDGSVLAESRQRISDSLKRYFAAHPEVVVAMSERTKKYFQNPEARENAKRRAIDNRAHERLIYWHAMASQEEKQAHYDTHSEFMTEWHKNNRERYLDIAAKRNEKFRSEEHRAHMSDATRKYITENPEADKRRREKASESWRKKTAVYHECLLLLRDYLVKLGKIKAGSQATPTALYQWKKKGKIPLDLKLPESYKDESGWQEFHDSLPKGN